MLQEFVRHNLSRSEYMIWHSRRNPHSGDGAEHGFGVATHPLDDLDVDIPIIILSVVTDKAVLDGLVLRGASHPFVKLGVLPQELLSAVKDVLGSAGSDRNAAGQGSGG